MTEAEYADGSERCSECRRLFNKGDRYFSTLVGLVDDVPQTEPVCRRCERKTVTA